MGLLHGNMNAQQPSRGDVVSARLTRVVMLTFIGKTLTLSGI